MMNVTVSFKQGCLPGGDVHKSRSRLFFDIKDACPTCYLFPV